MISVPELAVSFFAFSFLGWCVEAVITSIREGRFINRGFLLGPLVPLYGVCSVLLSMFFEPDQNSILVLCVGSSVLFGTMEFWTGFAMERHFHAKWWDYSDRRHNLMGYICIEHVLVKGCAIALLVKYVQPLIRKLPGILPDWVLHVGLIALTVLLGIDVFASYVTARKLNRDFTKAEWLIQGLRRFTDALGIRIADTVLKRTKGRMEKAFPRMQREEEEIGPKRFAQGMNRYKLFWIFFIASLVGDLVETVFIYATTGKLMSRSSLLYGPFSVVWGFGAVILTVVLQGLAKKNDRHIFMGGLLIGGIYEYACSVVTEMCFGTVFWDYSKIPFNLNGRINLLFCVFWGVLALVWVKGIYPKLSALIEKIPLRAGKPLTIALAIFLAADGVISVAALVRMDVRGKGNAADNAVEVFLDDTYPDRYLVERYRNMKFVTEDGAISGADRIQ